MAFFSKSLRVAGGAAVAVAMEGGLMEKMEVLQIRNVEAVVVRKIEAQRAGHEEVGRQLVKDGEEEVRQLVGDIVTSDAKRERSLVAFMDEKPKEESHEADEARRLGTVPKWAKCKDKAIAASKRAAKEYTKQAQAQESAGSCTFSDGDAAKFCEFGGLDSPSGCEANELELVLVVFTVDNYITSGGVLYQHPVETHSWDEELPYVQGAYRGYGCDGRNELGWLKGSVDECVRKCASVSNSCISFEYFEDGRKGDGVLGCQLSTSCTRAMAKEARQQVILYTFQKYCKLPVMKYSDGSPCVGDCLTTWEIQKAVIFQSCKSKPACLKFQGENKEKNHSDCNQKDGGAFIMRVANVPGADFLWNISEENPWNGVTSKISDFWACTGTDPPNECVLRMPFTTGDSEQCLCKNEAGGKSKLPACDLPPAYTCEKVWHTGNEKCAQCQICPSTSRCVPRPDLTIAPEGIPECLKKCNDKRMNQQQCSKVHIILASGACICEWK